MMQLGDFQFVVPSTAYQQIKKSYDYRWEQQNTLGKMASLQYTGRPAEVISFSGVSYTDISYNRNFPDTLKAMADRAKPYLLISGNGEILGEFVIEKLAFEVEDFYANGIPRKTSFSVDLLRYDD